MNQAAAPRAMTQGWRWLVGSTEGRRVGGWAGDTPVRFVSGGWENRARASASGVLAAEPVAAALLGDHGGGASNCARRRRFWR